MEQLEDDMRYFFNTWDDPGRAPKVVYDVECKANFYDGKIACKHATNVIYTPAIEDQFWLHKFIDYTKATFTLPHVVLYSDEDGDYIAVCLDCMLENEGEI